MSGGLFQLGDFTLASGRKAGWKIECDALGPDDWAALALMAVEAFGSPGAVTGVPRGGIPFADALRPHCRIGAGPTWVVDDVLTTGGSMTRHLHAFARSTNTGPTMGVVAFARGSCPEWIRPLFQLAPPQDPVAGPTSRHGGDASQEPDLQQVTAGAARRRGPATPPAPLEASSSGQGTSPGHHHARP